ncbi:hypothetical protein [Paraoerskovia marina]|uniref:hypothetical protein n=1 Tax=Paraoerskovia marina TaxID=545619 RepID=UPI000492C0BF|nr:hypothetical protein [Paraoerskovia marina]
MSSLGPGTTLVGRYRLGDRQVTDLVDVEAWSAHDTVLDRQVRISVVRGDSAGAALDAARRAALISDSRLTRVLDVGAQEGVSYVVTESFRGTPLTEVVEAGQLSADQARAVVGEAAAALEAARRRGVHHLALRPSCVRIDGRDVIVTGLGLDGGVAGRRLSDDAASRADSVGLVALLYYILTTRWGGAPLDDLRLTAGNPAPLSATRRDGTPVPPPDVPADLAALTTSTLALGSQSGPQVPGDVVADLEPWPELAPPAPPTPIAPEPPRGAPVRQSSRGPRIHRTSAFGAAGAGAAAGAAGAANAAGAVGAPTGPVPTQHAPVPTRPPQPAAPQSGPQPQQPGAGPARTSAFGASAASTAQFGAPPAAPTQTSAGQPLGAAPAGAGAGTDGSSSTGGRFDPTWIVIALAALAVILVLVWSLNKVFSPFDSTVDAAPDVSTSDESAAPEDTGEETEDEPTEEPTSEAPVVVPEIDDGDQLDPQGEEAGDTAGEHPEAVERAHDGQPETFWYTRTYGSPQFGGLKDGVGYAVELKEPAEVSTVILDTNNTGGNVEIRATDSSDPTGGDVLASGSLEGQTEFNFDATEVDTFVLWFTELPQAADGGNRVELKEIIVS